MLASLLFAATMWGTDPRIVFAEDCAPCIQQLTHVPYSKDANRVSQQRPVGSLEAFPQPLIIRGQTVSDDFYPYADSNARSFWDQPFVKEFLSAMDPFAAEEVRTLPGYYDPFGVQMGTGSNGPLGYRLGWTTYNDITILPATPAHDVGGNMKIVEWNSYLKYSHRLQPGVIFNGTGWFSARFWDGPGGIGLPPQVDQVSTDLELGFFNDGPWSGQIAFHPQIVETYEARLNRNAFNFDGRAIAMFKASPQWSFVGGVAIWDRVNTLIVPHVGAIWTPNNRWEFRILFPRTRVSYFLGNRWNADFWLYSNLEYTAEAWQANLAAPPAAERIQLTDQRLSLGLRWDSGRYSFFTEGGYVFNRHVKFAGSTPAYDLGDSAMIRFGLRY